MVHAEGDAHRAIRRCFALDGLRLGEQRSASRSASSDWDDADLDEAAWRVRIAPFVEARWPGR